MIVIVAINVPLHCSDDHHSYVSDDDADEDDDDDDDDDDDESSCSFCPFASSGFVRGIVIVREALLFINNQLKLFARLNNQLKFWEFLKNFWELLLYLGIRAPLSIQPLIIAQA